MNRTTKAHLAQLVARINEAAGSPAEPWTKGEDGRYVSNVGTYYLEQSNGGSSLAQMVSEGGGMRTIFGLTTGGCLASQMRAWLAGRSAR